jgi:vacuolar protein sorting-associated protein IST1
VVSKVVRKLGIDTPSADLVDAYLGEIAKAYGVEWTAPGNNDHDVGPEGGVKVSQA